MKNLNLTLLLLATIAIAAVVPSLLSAADDSYHGPHHGGSYHGGSYHGGQGGAAH